MPSNDLAESRTRRVRFDLATGEERGRLDLEHRLDCAPAHPGHLWCGGEALTLVRLDDLEIVADASSSYGEGAPEDLAPTPLRLGPDGALVWRVRP